MKENRIKKKTSPVFLGLIIITLTTLGTLLSVLTIDIFLHHRFEKASGLNYQGYRGKVLSKKQKNEFRIVMLGGSTTFGYGVHWNETIPYFLEQYLIQKNSGNAISVANLGMNNHGVFSFLHNLEDYKYLEYDAAILYEGYNDIPVPKEFVANLRSERRRSNIFRFFGYLPIFPMVFEEKAMSIRYNGDLEKAYKNYRVFRPEPQGIIKKAKVITLEKVSHLATKIDAKALPNQKEILLAEGVGNIEGKGEGYKVCAPPLGALLSIRI